VKKLFPAQLGVLKDMAGGWTLQGSQFSFWLIKQPPAQPLTVRHDTWLGLWNGGYIEKAEGIYILTYTLTDAGREAVEEVPK